MGIYYSVHLMFGVVGNLKEESEKTINNLQEEVFEFAVPKKLVAILFDPTYKERGTDEENFSLFVGYEIGSESDITNFPTMDELKAEIEIAERLVDKILIMELEERFPEFNWSPIRLRNIITVG